VSLGILCKHFVTAAFVALAKDPADVVDREETDEALVGAVTRLVVIFNPVVWLEGLATLTFETLAMFADRAVVAIVFFAAVADDSVGARFGGGVATMSLAVAG